MLSFLRKHQVPLLIIGTLVLLLSYIQMLHASEGSPRLVTATLPEKEYEKLGQQLTLITERHNPREAFSLLRRKMKESNAVVVSCHGLAHTLGHAAYMKYQDFGKAMGEAEQLCNSGYVHGVIESYFSDLDDFATEAVTVCEAYDSGTFTRWQCDHGVGHGMMFATENDLPQSLQLCEGLTRDDARERCISGVFMENVMVDQKAHVSRYVQADDPFYPCRDQQIQYKPHCYGYVPTNYLKSHEGKYENLHDLCDKAEPEFISSCVQGIGSIVIVAQLDRPDEVIRLCMQSEKYADFCLTGMLHEFINHYATSQPASKLCSKFPLDKQSFCVSVVRQKSVLF